MLYGGCVERWQRVSQERLWIMSESMGYIWQVKNLCCRNGNRDWGCTATGVTSLGFE